MKKEKGLIVTLFYIISLINIGDSSFLITNSLIVPTQTIAKSDEPVCYIDDIYFTSVEKALQFADEDNSSNVINIIPNLENDVIISDSCTIGKGDVLCLPYEITNNEAFYMYDYDDILTYSLGESSDDNYFADYDTNHVNNNRVTNLKLLEDVKIYNEGTISVYDTATGQPLDIHSPFFGWTEAQLYEIARTEGNLDRVFTHWNDTYPNDVYYFVNYLVSPSVAPGCVNRGSVGG